MTQSIYPPLRYDDGSVGHAELALDGAVVMVSSKKAGDARFPAGPTMIYFALDDPDSHHDRAVAAGADIVHELVNQDYGSREYAAKDPGGNVWSFGTYRPQT